MEQLLIEVAKQVPALSVLVILVIVFVRDRRQGSEQSDRAFKERDAMVCEIARESNACHEKCAKSMSESAEVIRQNTAALARFNERHPSGNHRAAAGD